MSDAGVRSDIEREFEEAKETARAYLRAVGVIGPDQFSAREFREYDEGIMRHAILNRGTGVVDLPNDPLAREAALLGIRYLRCGRDDKILETLIGNASMPANRAVLDVLKSETLALGEDMPERLRAWEPTSTKKRWRREPTRNYRIGMVVEALVTGRRILIPYGKGEKLHVQLQRDLQAMYAVSGKPFEELSSEEVLVSLNRMWARRRKNRNEGKRLTERDLVELTKEPLPAQAGIHGIVPNTDVRESFPNLYPTRNDATKDKGRPYSICDAVANVLREARQKGSDYRTVLIPPSGMPDSRWGFPSGPISDSMW